MVVLSVTTETLQAAFKGNFPGIDLEQNLFAPEIDSLLSPILDMVSKPEADFSAVASVSGVPSLKHEEIDNFS